MKFKFRPLLCLLLALILLAEAGPLRILAVEQAAETVLYIKEIKIFTKSDKAEAAQQGYTLLDTDLNPDSAGDPVYIGYQTTTDPTEAICDLKLMNMSGGYKFTNLEDIYSQQGDTFTLLANWFLTLVEAYAQAYKDGSVMAHSVFDALNVFRIDSLDDLSNSTFGFGDFAILDTKSDNTYAIKLLLLCNSTYLDTVIKLLSTGIQDQGNWLYNMSSMGPYQSGIDYGLDLEYVQNSEDLQKAAQHLLPILQQHAQIYNLMEKTGTFDEPEYDEDGDLIQKTYYVPTAEEAQILEYCMGLGDYYEAAFDELALYPYGEGQTLKDFFCSLETLPKTKVNQLYPLLASLTPGQYAALYFGSVPEMILGTRIIPQEQAVTGDEFTAQVFSEAFDTLLADAVETYGISRVSLFEGVDESLLDTKKTIAFTEEAERHKSTTGELDYFENAIDRQQGFEHNLRFVALLGVCGMGVMAVSKISMGITAMVTGAKTLAALGTLAGFKGSFCSVLVSLCGSTGIIITLAVVAVAFLYSAIVYAIDYIEENYPDWDDYPIPDYLYDVTNTSYHAPVYVMYEAVTQNGTGEPADLNTFDGKQWLVLYASYDNVDGTRKPIKANDLKVQIRDGDAPEGYTPLCEFGEVVAKNLNAYDHDDTSGGVYFFYQQDTDVIVESTKTYYIKDVYLQTGLSDTECIEKLQNAGYTPLNQNLTPYYVDHTHFEGRRIYTYLGYKLTTVARAAVRDLRFTYDYNAASYMHGGISYGEHGTSGKLTLYASTMTGAGTPILADGLLVTEQRSAAPAGYEPVNLFSGGPAISVNHTDSYEPTFGVGNLYLYFLPETTFTEGQDYLGGLAHLDDISYDLFDGVKPSETPATVEAALQRGLEFWLGEDADLNDYDTVLEVLDLLFRNQLGYDHLCYVSEAGDNLDVMMYTTTKNPYRAIYDIQGTQLSNLGPTIVYSGAGYSSMATFHTYEDADFAMTIGVNCNPELSGRFLVAGNQANNVHVVTEDGTVPEQVMTKQDPILASELYIVIPEQEPAIPEGYLPIRDLFKDTNGVVSVKTKGGTQTSQIYLPDREAEPLPYIDAIYSVDYASLYRSYVATTPELSSSVLSDAQALPALVAQGATHFSSKDLGMPLSHFGNYENQSLNGVIGQGNVVKIGYSRTDNASAALRDLVFVCEGMSQGNPEKAIYHNGYKYTLLCEIGSWNYTGLEDNFTPRIYLYGSTDRRLGAPITELLVNKTPVVEDYHTVTTVNGTDVMSDVRRQLYLGAGSSNKELWYLCGAWLSRYTAYADFFFHIRREGESPLEQKPYIGALQLTDRKKIFSREDAPWLYDGEYYDMYESFFDAMARVDGDGYLAIAYRKLLSYQRVSDPNDAITDLTLYYSKDAPQTLTVNGIEYIRVGNVSTSTVNPAVLYYTCDPAAGDPISYLQLDAKIQQADTDQVNYRYVQKAGSTEYGQLLIGVYNEEHYLSMGRRTTIITGTYTPLKTYNNPSETRLSFTGTEEGKYISGIFIMDKNTLRQEKLAQGVDSDDCRCEDISEQEVHDRLRAMGATFVLDNHIRTDTDDHNRIYIGITRTDTASKALRDVVLYTDYLNTAPPEEKISINRKSYYLVAEKATDGTLPKAINLLGQEDEQDSPGAAIYLYVSKTAGDYLYELTLDTKPIVNGMRTVVSQNGMEVFEELAEQAKAHAKRIEDSPHFFGMDFAFLWYYYTIEEYMLEYNESVNDIYHPEEEEIRTWYLHTKNYPTETIEETLPYIGEVFVTYGQSKREAIVELLKFDVDGYIATDVNQDAGGDYVYIGYTRCASSAITDLVICEGKNPSSTKSITKKDTGVNATYALVAKVDLNKDAGGDWLYLYYTTDTDAGRPLTDIYITEGKGKTVDKVINGYRHHTVLKGSSGTKVDLNDGAGGDYLYLIQVRQEPPTVAEIAPITPEISILVEPTQAPVTEATEPATEATTESPTEVTDETTEATEPTTAATGDDDTDLTGTILSGGSIIAIAVFAAAALGAFFFLVFFRRKRSE